MYRNVKDVVSIEGVQVDAGSLWILSEVLTLIDDDQYVTHDLTDAFVVE